MTQPVYEHSYCMKCSTEVSQEQEVCECGSKSFVFGNAFTYEDKKVRCACGNDRFEMVMHINRSPYYNKTYRCGDCGNAIGVQRYVPNPYL
jgi:hypothetical protein